MLSEHGFGVYDLLICDRSTVWLWDTSLSVSALVWMFMLHITYMLMTGTSKCMVSMFFMWITNRHVFSRCSVSMAFVWIIYWSVIRCFMSTELVWLTHWLTYVPYCMLMCVTVCVVYVCGLSHWLIDVFDVLLYMPRAVIRLVDRCPLFLLLLLLILCCRGFVGMPLVWALFIYLLEVYSPVKRTGSPEGFSLTLFLQTKNI